MAPDKSRSARGLLAACLSGLLLHLFLVQPVKLGDERTNVGSVSLGAALVPGRGDIASLPLAPAEPAAGRVPVAWPPRDGSMSPSTQPRQTALRREPSPPPPPTAPRLPDAEAEAVCKAAANVDGVSHINVHTMIAVPALAADKRAAMSAEEIAAHDLGTPHCRCKRGFLAQGGGRVIGLNFGDWVRLDQWMLLLVHC